MSSLKACQSPTGGFGGGNQQLSHCAPTYAAVLALVAVGGAGADSGADSGGSSTGSASVNGSEDKDAEKIEDLEVQKLAYEAIDRPALYSWMLSLKVRPFSSPPFDLFRMNPSWHFGMVRYWYQ